MDLSQLEVFLAVARERRFSRAADKALSAPNRPSARPSASSKTNSAKPSLTAPPAKVF